MSGQSDLWLAGMPDGAMASSGGAVNGISNPVNELNAVIAVFLTDAIPPAMPAPEALIFRDGGVNSLSFAPELKQASLL